ncbi:MAG: PQQ-dependent sugar dehydrogenase [Myxococcales bacterium]|nr:PQQ-dependent sugar dehydrogenase [Myxococcales bacterium]
MRRAVLALTLGSGVIACGGGGGSSPPIDAASDDGTTGDVDAGGLDGPSVDAATFGCTPRAGTTVALAPVATGLDQPVALTGPVNDGRVFVVEQPGAIRLIKDGALVTAPYLDLSGTAGPVRFGGEQGLLGLAFHPQFGSNGRFYVNFTRKPDGATVIAEFTTAPGDDTAPVATRRDVLVIPQPYANHNGGWLEFGNDGKLYIGMGDGGSGGDPQDRAQDDAALLGKILRIDVDTRTGAKAYGIPTDNPHAGSVDGATDPRPEIWHKGVRNPFRWSFDRATGDLYIGDVGQNAWEEVDFTPNLPGVNWGWDDREGAHCYEPTSGCLTAGRTDPVTEHAAAANWHSVIGGQVYRGACFPDLVGTYFYGDYSAAELWSFRIMNGAAQNDQRVLQSVGAITHVHSDGVGELYVVTHDGRVRRVVVP